MSAVWKLLTRPTSTGQVLSWARHGVQALALPGLRQHSGDHGKKNPLRGKTPTGKLDPLEEMESEENVDHERLQYGEKEPLEKFPNNKNPVTGEIGGPRGPEPTRYGDWERKGRVTDF